MKKSLVILFALFCFVLPLIIAEDISNNLQQGVEKLEDVKDNIDELKKIDTNSLVGKITDYIKESYAVKIFDEGFNLASPVFEFFLREPYSLSWNFFILLFLWIFLFWNLSKFFNSLFFSTLAGWIIGLISMFFLVYSEILGDLSSLIVEFVLSITSFFRYFVILLLIFSAFILHLTNSFFSKYALEQKKKAEEEREKFSHWMYHKMRMEYLKKFGGPEYY